MLSRLGRNIVHSWAQRCSRSASLPPRRRRTYPNRPIRIVIAFPAGGPTDFVGRLLADKLKDTFGQIIIENKPGANGAIGADHVAKSAPDGYTLFLSTVGAVAITPHMRTDLPYDTLRDFAPVTLVVRNTTLLVVRADSPVNNDQGLRRDGEGEERQLTVRHDRRRLDHASGDRDALDRGRVQIRARALSRRGARADRSARRPGAGASSPTCRC